MGRSFPNFSDGGLGRLWGPAEFRGYPTGSPTAPAASSLRVAGCGPRVASPPGGQRRAEWRPRAGESPPALPPSPPGESRPPGSGGQHQLLDGRCPKAPVAGLQPLLQKQSLLVQPRSARRRQARALGLRGDLLELRGGPARPPRTPLHPLVPPLHSQVCSSPDCPGSSRILKNRLPPPRPPPQPPGVWLATKKNWPLGCSGSPGPRVRPGSLPPALCVRAAKLRKKYIYSPCGYAARGGMIRGLLGGRRRQSSLGATRASCCTQASRVAWSRPPASPPLQGQSKPGRGGARPQGRARSGASGAAGKGLWLVLVFAKQVWEGSLESRDGGRGRPESACERNLAPGPRCTLLFLTSWPSRF